MIDDILKYRRHVNEFEDEIPDKELINSLLQKTWKVTLSKNNFMAYTVHVVTDNSTKKLIYNMCTANEKQVNENSTTEGEYKCILTAPYVLLFTQRLEDKPNKRQQELINKIFIMKVLILMNLKIYILQTLLKLVCLQIH